MMKKRKLWCAGWRDEAGNRKRKGFKTRGAAAFPALLRSKRLCYSVSVCHEDTAAEKVSDDAEPPVLNPSTVFDGRERMPAKRNARLFLVRRIVFLLAVIAITGCAGRRPVTPSVPPAPAPQAGPAPSSREGPSPRPPAASTTQPPTRNAPFVPGIYVEQGTASWYGIPFHGRRAANGEIFDMNTLVAAHRTLPFGSIVRVTNLNNGRDVEVRVIDRGPFVGDRILDLARAAAVSLDMIGSGTAPVRIELLSGPSPALGEFTVQVGAFADRANAERLRARLLARYQPIFIQDYDSPTGHFYRVRVGRVPSPDAAQQLATQLRSAEGFQQTFVMRLDQPYDLGAK